MLVLMPPEEEARRRGRRRRDEEAGRRRKGAEGRSRRSREEEGGISRRNTITAYSWNSSPCQESEREGTRRTRKTNCSCRSGHPLTREGVFLLV
jgi:hypothetical protein